MTQETAIEGRTEVAARVSIWPGKLRAVAAHFAFSLIAFGIVLYLIVAHWYPGLHFFVDGGWQGVRILIGVDLVLGPLLTLIIFDTRKSALAIGFDLLCIATVQIGALIWGVGNIHSQRISGMAFLDNGMITVFAEDLEDQGLPSDLLYRYSDLDPPAVYVRPARFGTPEFAKTAAMATVPRQAHTHLYENWRDSFDQVLKRGAFDFEAASDDFPEFAAHVQAWLEEHGRSADSVHLLLYYGRFGRRMLVFDGSGTLLGALPYFNPEEADQPPPLLE